MADVRVDSAMLATWIWITESSLESIQSRLKVDYLVDYLMETEHLADMRREMLETLSAAGLDYARVREAAAEAGRKRFRELLAEGREA